MEPYTLGLDIGSNSIGWTLVAKGKKPSIIDIGVRVFPEGVDRDTKGFERSKSATRREARGARRVHQRRNRRRNFLLQELQKSGLLPKNEGELSELFKKDPYELRRKGLNDKLSLYEFGRAVFHINQRRGFKSNRKTGESKENNKIAKEAGALQQKIEGESYRTLGEYLASLNPEEQRRRDWYTFRSMYEKELDLLWEKQSKFWPDTLTNELKEKIRDKIIFYQRPIWWDPKTIGDCELEEAEKRCPRGDWYARRFRMLQDVNNLKIIDPDGSENKLDNEQRRIVFEQLSKTKEVSFSSLRKKLGLIETQEFNFEYEVDEKGKKREKLKGDEFNARMLKIFGAKKWGQMTEDEKTELNNAILEMEDDELEKTLLEKYSLNKDQIRKAFKINLPKGYMSFSRKAIKKLIEVMQEGKRTDEAIADVYGQQKEQNDNSGDDKLYLPPDLRNPIVQKGLFEARKVIKAVIKEYGRPAGIKIEMARDVRGNAKERRELQWKIKENEKRNEEARQWITEHTSIKHPSRDDIIKYNLWFECGKVCPYTGKTISPTDLFELPVFQVEHILPYSRSLDDSYMNKTLCCVEENRRKGDKTPHEFYQGTQQYEEIKKRIKALPWPKRKKFSQKELDIEQSLRNLNDTRYICREVAKYLKQVCKNVKGTRGKVTAELRHQWGLDGIFNELGTWRDDDHRRHAVDAVITAVTENEHLRQLAKSKYSVEGVKFEQPWRDFREEVREKVRHINVSHRATRKVSGPLHEETNYGITGRKDEKQQDIFVYRKKLEELTVPMVEKIVDPVVRGIVGNRLSEFGIDGSQGRKIPKEVWAEPLYMKSTKSSKKVPIKKVRIRDVIGEVEIFRDKNGKPYRAVKTGSNHHVEIFEYTNGDKKGQRDSKVVTMFVAVQRSRSGEPVVKRDHGQGTRFICSLTINDMVMMKDKRGEMNLYRVQKMAKNKMVRFRHHSAATIDSKETYIDKTAHLFEGHKVTVDPLGQIFPAND